MSTLGYSKDNRGRDIIIADGCKMADGGWSNFAGREVKDRVTGEIRNSLGARNFGIIIDNAEDLNLLREESINVKAAKNDLEDDGIVEAKVKVKVKIRDSDDGDPKKSSPIILLRVGIKDENGNYVNKFKRFDNRRIAELDELRFDECDFVFGISRKNPIHALYLNKAWLTTTYAPNPLELKHMGMCEDDFDDGTNASSLDGEVLFE